MHKGLTHATLGVLGAALLSGSVFAAGPTLKDLPDVIISDKLKEAVVAEKNANSDINIYDEETAATEDRYRFTDAFDLSGYIQSYDSTNGDSLTSTQLSEIKYLFVEWADLAQTSVNVSTETIRINGATGVDSVPDYATISSSPDDVFNDGLLDFVNQDRSGSIDATVPNPTPIVGNFTDITALTLYVASPNSTNPDVDSKDFRVYTTNDVDSLGFLGDALSAPTSIYTSELVVDDFAGWYITALNSLPQFTTPAPGMFTRTQDASSQPATWSPIPSVSSTSELAPAFNILVNPSGTNTLSISTLASPGTASGTTGIAPQYASWASWRRDHDAVKSTVLTQAGRVYLTRWTVSGSSITPYQAPKVRFRVGESTDMGAGQISDEMVDNGSNAIVGGPKEHLTFYYAHAAGEIGFLMDVFDYYNAATASTLQVPNGQANYTITLDKVEVFSVDPDQFGSGSVVFNEGGAVTLAAGEEAPPSGEVAFNTTANQRYLITDLENLGAGGDGRQTVQLTASQGSFAYVAGNNGVLGVIQPYWVAVNTGSEVIDNLDNDELIRIDVWLSSPQGSTANNSLPIVRFGAQTDAWGESGSLSPIISQGRTMYHTFRGTNRNGLDVGETITPVMALQSGARRYSLFFTPNLHSGASTIDCRPTVECYSFPLFSATENNDQNTNPEPFMAGTVLFHRAVVTKYALPAGSRTN